MAIEGISPQIDEHEYVESKIRDVIKESELDLWELNDNLHTSLEWKLDDTHVTAMLQHSLSVFTAKSYSDAINELWAGYILPLQAKLKSLWYYTDEINGMYQGKGSATYNAVKLFQESQWLTADWWAGKETLQKLINTANDNVNWVDQFNQEYTVLDDVSRKNFTWKGKYTRTNGNVYEWDWVDGKRTWKGKYTRANGNRCEWDFVDWKKINVKYINTQGVEFNEIDSFGNEVRTVDSIDSIPHDDTGELRRSDPVVYNITINNISYILYGNGRAFNQTDENTINTSDLIHWTLDIPQYVAAAESTSVYNPQISFDYSDINVTNKNANLDEVRWRINEWYLELSDLIGLLDWSKEVTSIDLDNFPNKWWSAQKVEWKDTQWNQNVLHIVWNDNNPAEKTAILNTIDGETNTVAGQIFKKNDQLAFVQSRENDETNYVSRFDLKNGQSIWTSFDRMNNSISLNSPAIKNTLAILGNKDSLENLEKQSLLAMNTTNNIWVDLASNI